jgi:hypothetical protein
MPRNHVEFVHALDVAVRGVDAGTFAGTQWRTLSADRETGTETALVEFPAPWEARLGVEARPIELLLLSGAGALGDRPLRAGTWAWVPAGTDEELRFDEAARVLLMLEEERARGGEVELVDTVEARFTGATTAVPPGLAIKLLRIDPDSGDRSWIAASVPGWLGERAETHPTVEEALLLRGDCLLANVDGEMRAGDYFWRPGGVLHGPFATRNGMLFFFRTKGGDMVVDFHEVPGWRDVVGEYYAREPFFSA